MTYLCLDTCSWIYLANGTEPVKILRLIAQEVDRGEIKLIVPELVIREFSKNKKVAIQSTIARILEDIEQKIGTLDSLLGEGKNPEFMSFILDKVTEIESFRNYKKDFRNIRKLVNEGVKENIEQIEKLFNNDKVIKISHESIANEVVDFGIEKKAPFNKKNGTADTVILLSFLNYVRENNILGAKFISHNTSDFCEKINNNTQLHSELVPLFAQNLSEFYFRVADCINSYRMAFIDNFELNYIEELELLEDGEHFCFDCAVFHKRKSHCTKFNLSFWDNREQKIKFENTEITCLFCENCKTFYIECLDCKELIYSFDEEEPSELICENCNLRYEISYDFDSYELDYITLEDIIIKCNLCGENFLENDTGNNICDKCEHNLSYN